MNLECLVAFCVRSSGLSVSGDPCVHGRITPVCTYGDLGNESESVGIRNSRPREWKAVLFLTLLDVHRRPSPGP